MHTDMVYNVITKNKFSCWAGHENQKKTLWEKILERVLQTMLQQ